MKDDFSHETLDPLSVIDNILSFLFFFFNYVVSCALECKIKKKEEAELLLQFKL